LPTTEKRGELPSKPELPILQDGAKSWRDVLPVHPAAELFPLMSQAELKELGEDIKANGLTNPIVLWQSDEKTPAVLLDGRNRLDAIEMVIGSPKVSRWDVSVPGLTGGLVTTLAGHVDPFAYVVSANIRRRHLNVEQRQDLVIKIIAHTPEKSDRQIGKEIGVDHKTIARAWAKGEDVGRIPHVSTRTDTKGRKQPSNKTQATKPQPFADEPKPTPDQQAIRDNAAKRIRALMGLSEPKDDNPEPDCQAFDGFKSGERHGQDAEIEELQNAKRRLEIEAEGLRSEIKELKAERKPALDSKTASQCSICHECKRAPQHPVFICDDCAHIFGVGKAAPAPADDRLDIPELKRSAP
jgi:hypothetical protein